MGGTVEDAATLHDALPSEPILSDGYTREGDASGRVGTAWFDMSEGECYGGGSRYDFEESAGMAKIRGKARGASDD